MEAEDEDSSQNPPFQVPGTKRRAHRPLYERHPPSRKPRSSLTECRSQASSSESPPSSEATSNHESLSPTQLPRSSSLLGSVEQALLVVENDTPKRGAAASEQPQLLTTKEGADIIPGGGSVGPGFPTRRLGPQDTHVRGARIAEEGAHGLGAPRRDSKGWRIKSATNMSHHFRQPRRMTSDYEFGAFSAAQRGAFAASQRCARCVSERSCKCAF